ncbi:MAG: hypothetical protein ACP5NK_02140 [Thermoplasmata archaeon]
MSEREPSVSIQIVLGDDCFRMLEILNPDNDQSIHCLCENGVLKVDIPVIKYNSIFNVSNEILKEIEIFENVKKIQ